MGLVANVKTGLSESLAPLFEPRRYKVLHGGRSAGRSWGVAIVLLIMGTQRKLTVLCARELQNSINESVHRLLKSQIERLGLDGFYTIQQNKIFGQNGTEFLFEGIRNNTTKIKSYEGIDICWVEEAEAVPEAHWNILTPTIRKKGSEIWITFNPDLPTNYTYRHFVLDPPENSVVIKMTYLDNKWNGPEIFAEALEMKRKDPDKYLNVWMGNPVMVLDGAVYARELRDARVENRITTVRWERSIPVDCWWDLGRRDLTAIWFAQKVAMQIRVVGYIEDRGYDIGHFLKLVDQSPWTIGTYYLPHDATHERLGSRKTIEGQVRAGGKRTVRIVPKTPVVQGINAARMMFPNCWFDERACQQGLMRLGAYKYTVSPKGGYSKEPLHDDNSNAADALRYMGITLSGDTGVSESVSGVSRKLREWMHRGHRTAPSADGSSLDWMRR